MIYSNLYNFFFKSERLLKGKNVNVLLFKEQFKYLKTTHSYHLVDPSPWPLVASLGAFMMTTGLVLYMHRFFGGWSLFINGFLIILYVMYTWWRDVIREATFEDQHTAVVQKGLRLGMILFIASEVMFFFAFFWAFFHSSISPVYSIGDVWPPKEISSINVIFVITALSKFLGELKNLEKKNWPPIKINIFDWFLRFQYEVCGTQKPFMSGLGYVILGSISISPWVLIIYLCFISYCTVTVFLGKIFPKIIGIPLVTFYRRHSTDEVFRKYCGNPFSAITGSAVKALGSGSGKLVGACLVTVIAQDAAHKSGAPQIARYEYEKFSNGGVHPKGPFLFEKVDKPSWADNISKWPSQNG